MHIDKYVVNNIGTRWTNGKRKKGCLLASLDGTDISFKNLIIFEYNKCFTILKKKSLKNTRHT